MQDAFEVAGPGGELRWVGISINFGRCFACRGVVSGGLVDLRDFYGFWGLTYRLGMVS